MADIIKMGGLTFAPESPESVLEKAKGWGMERCIVAGFNERGGLIFGGSFAEAGDIVLLLEMAKKFVIENDIAREM